MNRQKQPLYRRYNKLALHYRAPCAGNEGGDFRHVRNTKFIKRFEGTHLPMNGKNRGRDYTPLFKFLLSKVGCKWDDVYSEAVTRLDSVEPVFYMVYLHERHGGVVRLGDSSYYSALTVNDDGFLIKINDKAEPPAPYCTCCTYTFNGEPY